jgi:predicted membrane protein
MNLDQLKNISKVDVPEKLFSNIQTAIEDQRKNRISKPVLIGVGIAALLLVALNIISMQKYRSTHEMATRYEITNNLSFYE